MFIGRVWSPLGYICRFIDIHKHTIGDLIMNTDRHVIINIVSFMENDSGYIRLMSHSYHPAAGKRNKQYNEL